MTVSVIETGNNEQLTSDQPQLTIEGLHPFYTYSFLIAAVTIGPGPFSEVLSIQMPQAGESDYSGWYLHTLILSNVIHHHLLHSTCGVSTEHFCQCHQLSGHHCDVAATSTRRPEWNHHVLHYSAL